MIYDKIRGLLREDKKKRYSERRRKQSFIVVYSLLYSNIRRNDTLKGDGNNPAFSKSITIFFINKKKRYSERRRKLFP